MFKQQIIRYRSEEEGFTLIELLVVIAILAILAGVVVFAVSGINDKGQTSACKIDTRTLRTAEEANFAKFGAYDTQANLKSHGFLDSQSDLHDIANIVGPNPGPASYDVVIGTNNANAKCGSSTAGTVVNGTSIF